MGPSSMGFGGNVGQHGRPSIIAAERANHNTGAARRHGSELFHHRESRDGKTNRAIGVPVCSPPKTQSHRLVPGPTSYFNVVSP